MGRASIATTMGYYVDIDSDDVADQLWAGWGGVPANQGNILGNNCPQWAKKPQEAPADQSAETPCNQDFAENSESGQGRDRTGDTRIFSPMLY